MQYQSQQNEVKRPTDGQHSAKILLVDDSKELLNITKEVLEVHGHDVTAVSSSAEAIARLTKQIPDIIICDIMMPERNGFEFHREVVSHPEWCDIPFIFLTALAGHEDVRMGKALGCDEYLTKPFDPDDLAAVVKGKLTLVRHRRKMASARLEGYRKRIIHTLSHEFRTPLVSINTGAELLIEQHSSLAGDQVTRLLQSVLRGGQRLERLVDDFMLLQQIDLGHAEHTYSLYRGRFSLRNIVETALDCFDETAPGQEPPLIEVEAPPEEFEKELYVHVYDIQVINVIQRLLSNAHKFGSPGEPIGISYGAENGQACIRIWDRGPGIADEANGITQARLPFQQLDRETLEQQGCGVGLTIAHHFTEINGGQLRLYNRPPPETGLEAELTFPLVEPR